MARLRPAASAATRRRDPGRAAVLGAGLPLGSSALVGLFHVEKTFSLQSFFSIGKSYMGLCFSLVPVNFHGALLGDICDHLT